MPKDSFPDADEVKPASPVMEFPVGKLDTSSDRGMETMVQQNWGSTLKHNDGLLECSPQQCCSVLEAVGLKSEQHSSSLALDCGCEQSVTVANNLGVLKELAPLRVLSGGSQGPEGDSSLMRSDCSVEGHILTVPELGAGPLFANTSSAYGGSIVEEELLNVVAYMSGDCCADLEEHIVSESIQQIAVPLPVAGVSDESGESQKVLLDVLLKQSGYSDLVGTPGGRGQCCCFAGDVVVSFGVCCKCFAASCLGSCQYALCCSWGQIHDPDAPQVVLSTTVFADFVTSYYFFGLLLFEDWIGLLVLLAAVNWAAVQLGFSNDDVWQAAVVAFRSDALRLLLGYVDAWWKPMLMCWAVAILSYAVDGLGCNARIGMVLLVAEQQAVLAIPTDAVVQQLLMLEYFVCFLWMIPGSIHGCGRLLVPSLMGCKSGAISSIFTKLDWALKPAPEGLLMMPKLMLPLDVAGCLESSS
ncbi:hypothetical protein Nepgr_006758 [Nepenthes gracilis]|uniref:Uncharacterized protein n=1 Tax=Nepenthes gracilis TaxID=150966 RepID=A0AAD3XHN4_NEPGR|nr:hypothetical protein Nepgr_006758 [Nepenthes gracilis]